MFLLDTNIICDARKPKPPPALKSWLRSQDEIAIPFPAMLEIEQGIAELRKTNPLKAQELRDWMDSVLAGRHYYPAINSDVARILAEMYCCRPLKNLWYIETGKKEKKPGQDLFVAAIAICHSLPIATSDTYDFVLINRHFPLPGVFSPMAQEWAVPLPTFTPERSRIPPRATVTFGDHALSEQSVFFG
ncbi:hypothetical protein GGQ64_004990 [Rhizobium azooxidifex]|uniref:PIN domain-containing protein n=1 Tax=Mycoplana azooxidifex TaxID=1636188 RepID=A0A7W6GLI7_9HYPH|nr:type II toxin-antitoxin system VapC family toxin [Mycoplana azooxidifex]MBB3979745.1 hypothetical protein [Mycoplana azooxidifex]